MNAILMLTLVTAGQWDVSPKNLPTWDVRPREVQAINGWNVSPATLSRTIVQDEAAEQLLETLRSSRPLATKEAAHTPMAEVIRVLDLLPRPEIGFVDLGCGYDARWCIAAAEKWGCRVTGIEIDPQRARAARDRVRELGLDHLITIIEGDAGTVMPLQADVAVAYLYPDLLARLKPRLAGFRAFASYMHQPPGLPVVRNGDSFIYNNPTPLVWSSNVARATYQQQVPQPQPVRQQQKAATWQGVQYTSRVCTSRGCQMCNSIQYQINGF